MPGIVEIKSQDEYEAVVALIEKVASSLEDFPDDGKLKRLLELAAAWEAKQLPASR